MAQNSKDNRTFLDRYRLETKDIGEAVYYRLIEGNVGKFKVREYYKSNDQLAMEAYCEALYPVLKYDGLVTNYYENGKIKGTTNYKHGIREGECKEYYEDGSLHSYEICGEDKNLLCEYFSTTGEALLANGTGTIAEENADRTCTIYREVRDSVLLASYSVERATQDTVYLHCDVPAEYRNGFSALYKEIGKTLRYPAMAKRYRIEGRVFVEFTIGKDGKPENVHALRGIGGGCDEEACSVMAGLKGWVPAKHKGKLVKSKMVLPIVFKLG